MIAIGAAIVLVTHLPVAFLAAPFVVPAGAVAAMILNGG